MADLTNSAFEILTPTNGTSDVLSPLKCNFPHSKVKSFHALAGTSSGSGTANIQFYGSNVAKPNMTDLRDWVPIGSSQNVAPTGTAWSSLGFSETNSWLWFTCKVTNLSGTNISAKAYIAG